MFVVVAIVIFGIFVVLANTLFGSEGLTNDLANLFTQAISQSEKSLDKSMIQASEFKHWKNFTTQGYDNDGRVISLDSTTGGQGVELHYTNFEPNKNYEISFNYEVLDGTVYYIGGHFALSDNTKVYVDGKLINSDWHTPRYEDFTQEEGVHTVKILLNTYRYDSPFQTDTLSYTTNRNFYIQPNRHKYDVPYKIEISNIRMFKID